MDIQIEACSPVEVTQLRHNPRVLLADDDVELLTLFGVCLRSSGYDVVEAADGTEALELLSGLPETNVDPVRIFDAAVLDIRMPGFSGLHVLAALRHSLPALPVVLMTAFSDDRIRKDAHRLGASAMLSKPFRLQALTWAVACAVGA
jgi:two-component system, response regulator, stage 0 sporulation protein F